MKPTAHLFFVVVVASSSATWAFRSIHFFLSIFCAFEYGLAIKLIPFLPLYRNSFTYSITATVRCKAPITHYPLPRCQVCGAHKAMCISISCARISISRETGWTSAAAAIVLVLLLTLNSHLVRAMDVRTLLNVNNWKQPKHYPLVVIMKENIEKLK